MTATAIVREHPIIFSAPMVRAILEGRKSQTRRIVGVACGTDTITHREGDVWIVASKIIPVKELTRCPYGKPGDRLWCRENFALVGGGDPGIPLYAADWKEDAKKRGLENIPDKPPRWTPSIHMPRWASRITLEITDIRVERLRDITEADILAEGMTVACVAETTGIPWSDLPTLHHAWAAGWDHINGKRAPWASNPWVFVVEFKRVNCWSSPSTSVPTYSRRPKR